MLHPAVTATATAAANESHSQLTEGATAAARMRISGRAAEDERSASGGGAAKDDIGQGEEEKEVN